MTRSAWRIRRLVARFCSDHTLERLIDPVLTDIEVERREALESGRRWRARWMLITGYAALAKALTLHACVGTARDRGARRIMASTLTAFVVLTCVFILPPLLRDSRTHSFADLMALSIYLVPQAIPLSFPLALAYGIVRGWSQGGWSRAGACGVMALGIFAMALSLAMMEWLIPAANQAYRTSAVERLVEAGRSPRIALRRGIGERSLSELAAMTRRDVFVISHAADSLISLSNDELRFLVGPVRRQFHLRLALACAAGPLCLVAIVIAFRIRQPARARLAFAAAAVLYVAAMFAVLETRSGSAFVLWVWVPNAALCALALVVWSAGSIGRPAARV